VRRAKAREQKEMATEMKKKSITRSGRDGSSERMVWQKKARIEGRSGEGAKSARTIQSLVSSGVGLDHGHAFGG
jgi:hypothetical protein